MQTVLADVEMPMLTSLWFECVDEQEADAKLFLLSLIAGSCNHEQLIGMHYTLHELHGRRSVTQRGTRLDRIPV